MTSTPSQEALDRLGGQTKPQKRACRWWEPHNWSAWSAPEPGVKRFFGGNAYDITIQGRTCARCGLQELRQAQ